ncbi:hypothetical protein BUALT_Bualt15G0061100 [Buddleja alternifolia]|uniref:CHCH domain-containing protein n=1 Tax=Buddleja alternifolia TaxID=168488 RepID=A0AAV6WNU9_9LAMI|nr:hypothetical protein BUALT_Bualt15G0061100 [Buddleja alternifolia]
MPRRSSGGRSERPARRPAARSAPAKVNRAPPPAPDDQGSAGGLLLGSILEGVVVGVGNAIGRRIVDAVMGPRTIKHETVTSKPAAAPAPAPAQTSMGGGDACNTHSKAFQDCLNDNDTNISKCQFYMDMLTECKRNPGSVMSS